jgi:hypothetical protein
MTAVKRKKYLTPKAMARAFVNGSGFRTDGYYELYARDYNGKPVAVVATAGIIGAATGKSIWKIEIFPHAWAQEVADEIWRSKWEKPTKETRRPGRDVCRTGWICGLHVEIEFSNVSILEAD